MEAAIIVLSIICIVLIVWLSATISAALTLIKKLKAKLWRQKQVNTYQQDLIASQTKVICDQKTEIDSYKFVCKASEDITIALEKEIKNKEEIIKQLIPIPDGN